MCHVFEVCLNLGLNFTVIVTVMLKGTVALCCGSEQLNGAEDLPAPYDKDRIIFHSLETLAEAMMDTG